MSNQLFRVEKFPLQLTKAGSVLLFYKDQPSLHPSVRKRNNFSTVFLPSKKEPLTNHCQTLRLLLRIVYQQRQSGSVLTKAQKVLQN